MIKILSNKKIMIVAIAAVVIVAVILGVILWERTPAEASTVEQGSVVKLIKEMGTVESHSAVTIYAKAGGTVGRIAVSEGDNVNVGDMLLPGDEGSSVAMDIKSLQAQAAGVQAQYRQAKEIADKNKKLYEEGALSYEAYNQSLTAEKQLQAQLSSMQYTAKSMTEAGDVSGISAPIEGVVTGVFVKEGETAMPGAPLFEISNLNDLYVKTDLIAEDADKVEEGADTRVYNKDADFEDKDARVSKVELKAREAMSELGISQKRVTVEVLMSDVSGLRLGSDVDVEITAAEKTGVLRVAKEAVFRMEKKDYVYVIENGKARLREVEIGLEGDDYTEVLSGLELGERIIKGPGNEIEDGTRIKIL